MKIIKKINNNVALAKDQKGNELIVFGRGVGFPAMPYELTDLSVVDRTFYDVNDKYIYLLREVPEELILAADDIAKEAREELECELNPNLPFLLADHLNYVIHHSSSVAIHTPLAYDVRHLYPQEYAIAHRGRQMLREKLKVDLPESETISIALHLLNAEAGNSNMHSTIENLRVITELTELVEHYFDIRIDRESYSYSRFVMHLRYLVQRIKKGEPMPEDPATVELFRSIRIEYPEDYDCSQLALAYLAKNWDWHCTRDEQLYLILHIHRVRIAPTDPKC